MIDSLDEGGGPQNKKMSSTSESTTPVLDNFSRDLIKLASEGKLDPVIGREPEITRIAQILSRRKKNNPIIIGEAGCVLADTLIDVIKISDVNSHKTYYSKPGSNDLIMKTDVSNEGYSISELDIVKRTTIGDLFTAIDSTGGTYQIKTPTGFKLIGNLFVKLEKLCYKVVLSNGLELSGSEDHMVQTLSDPNDTKIISQNAAHFIKLKDIHPKGCFVFCQKDVALELSEVISIENIGIHDTFDLEVLDSNRTYLSNGISSHNCGKTAIAEGLAMRIFEGNCPRNLADKRILSLDMTAVVAGTKYRGQFEERMKVLIEELTMNPDTIIFIDEIHTIVGAGNSAGSMDASNIFKPALARGEIQCIGATTLDEYRKNFEKDAALERRFQKVMVEGTNKAETLTILENLAERYGNFHKVNFSPEVLETCVNLADRYITDREFPDKAIDIMDEVGARCQVDMKLPEIIENLKAQAQELKVLKIEVVKSQKYEEAADLRDKERKILAKLDEEKKKYESGINTVKKDVPLDMVYEVVANMTKIPVSKINADEIKTLVNLEASLNSKVIGQTEAVKKIAKSIRRNRLGIKDPKRPVGSYIFLASSGVGKTFLAKQLAKEVFGSEDSLIRFDMSEYQQAHTITRLIGAPPSFVGYEEGGQLTEAVKNKPFSVLLFDEIEKADKNIFTALLQMLDDGHMTDGIGRKVNFKNCIIIMTSNLGIKKLQDFGTGIGFSNTKSAIIQEEAKKEVLNKELKNFFPPEFLNRIDDIIIFNSLKTEDIDKIVLLELDILKRRLSEIKYKIEFDETICKMIAKIGFDELFGARPIKRAIQNKVEDFISEEILSGNIKEDITYTLMCDDEDNISIKKPSKKTK